MRKKIVVAFSSLLLLSLTSCQTSTKLYSWHHYENVAYANTKKHTEKTMEDLMTCYQKMILKQKQTRKTVPPGIYAEKGYQLVKSGKVDEGVECFKQEIALYPESKVFIERIIKQIEK